ncbi:uncharacterized protein [Typha angustifolia]|uniref:uncharacterized protein n=1 Tax=Typha angustifolia TaxID=59011 RepID=UPI003C2BD335
MKSAGMMCRSQAATAVCIPGDARSMIMARSRSDRTLVENSKLIDHLKYSRLAESRRFGSTGRGRSVTLPMVTKKESKTPTKPKPKPKPTNVPSLPPSTDDQLFQVVVMRVSLHCQGCAGKVRKHIKKMEGVTSFSIDLESKRVTVMGHVSPVGVLESISKVKKAEFWPC